MKSLKIYSIAFSLISLASCNNRELYVQDLNYKPEISFVSGNPDKTVLTDSVKLSLKSPDKASEFFITYRDLNNDLKEVTYSLDPGAGKLFQNNQEVTGRLTISEKNEMRYEPSALGQHKLTFTAEDKFGEKKSILANIHVFSNLSPVANLTLNPIKVLSAYEYELDASSSFDGDGKWGGGINVYTFFVNGRQIFKTNKSKMPYIFPEPGNYNVSVTVQDSDGAESTKTLTGVTIQ